jgi:hypothetical protein
MGYSIEALVQGEWRKPSLFKLNSVLDLDDLQSADSNIQSRGAWHEDTTSELDVCNLNTLILAASSLR